MDATPKCSGLYLQKSARHSDDDHDDEDDGTSDNDVNHDIVNVTEKCVDILLPASFVLEQYY